MANMRVVLIILCMRGPGVDYFVDEGSFSVKYDVEAGGEDGCGEKSASILFVVHVFLCLVVNVMKIGFYILYLYLYLPISLADYRFLCFGLAGVTVDGRFWFFDS